jgi:hypothetical protein
VVKKSLFLLCNLTLVFPFVLCALFLESPLNYVTSGLEGGSDGGTENVVVCLSASSEVNSSLSRTLRIALYSFDFERY